MSNEKEMSLQYDSLSQAKRQNEQYEGDVSSVSSVLINQ